MYLHNIIVSFGVSGIIIPLLQVRKLRPVGDHDLSKVKQPGNCGTGIEIWTRLATVS